MKDEEGTNGNANVSYNVMSSPSSNFATFFSFSRKICALLALISRVFLAFCFYSNDEITLPLKNFFSLFLGDCNFFNELVLFSFTALKVRMPCGYKMRRPALRFDFV